jgi:hypothetical protein
MAEYLLFRQWEKDFFYKKISGGQQAKRRKEENTYTKPIFTLDMRYTAREPCTENIKNTGIHITVHGSPSRVPAK